MYLGRNGAGKTTFVKLVLGLYEPSSGWILRERDSFVSQSAVFQNFQKYRMRLDDNICLKELECRDAEEMERAASLAGVEYGNSDLYPEKFGTLLGREFGGAELSGGQWQRIAIARGLYKEHDMIVLDEPTAMLDPNGRKDVIRAARALNDVENVTIILITHYMEEVIYADRVFVMDEGKVVMQGTPREIFSQVERLKHLRLDVPQVTLLAYELQKSGLKLPDGILTAQELTEELKKLCTGSKTGASDNRQMPVK